MADFEKLNPIKRGDTRKIKITATWPEDVPELGATAGDPYSLAGKEISAEFRDDRENPSPLIEKTDQSGIQVQPAPDDNVALIELASTDTSGFTESITLKLDVRVTDDAAGTRWTVASGDVPVKL